MKQTLLIAAAASAMIGAPSIASAQNQDEGWYLRGNVGYGIHSDTDIDNGLNGDVESEGDGAFSVGIGYDLGENWRVELDGFSLFTDLGAIGQQPSSTAKVRTNAVMLNAIYDFNDFGRWQPFVGAGVGFVQNEFSLVAHDFANGSTLVRNPACTGATAPNEVRTCNVNDDNEDIGWQILAGLGYAITDNLTWDTQYRYFDSGSASLNGTSTLLPSGDSSPILAQVDDVGGHALLTGFRYRFGAATPPPPQPDFACWDGSKVFNAGQCPPEPKPEPEVRCWDGSTVFAQSECPAQPETFTCWDGSLVYDLATCPVETRSRETIASLCGNQFRQEIIYYEFDRGESAETANTINRILDVGEFCNVDSIRVVGHTDTSGSAAYNLGLSKRRAADARKELIRQGIQENVITSEGKGETEPFVDTGDGVKEQLNRRTEVLITLSEIGGIN